MIRVTMSILKQIFFSKGYKMLTLEQIRQELTDRRPGMVAEATGLHINTVRDIRDNIEANPTYRVIEALSNYFEQKNG